MAIGKGPGIMARLFGDFLRNKEREIANRYEKAISDHWSEWQIRHAETRVRLEKARDAEISELRKQKAEEFIRSGALDRSDVASFDSFDVSNLTINSTNSLSQHILQQQALLQQAQLQQAQWAHQQKLAAMQAQTSNAISMSTAGYSGSLNTSPPITYGSGAYLNSAVTGTGHLVMNANPIARSLGTGTRDTLFLALKGIEEAAMKAPKGNHRYDSLAVDLLDMRRFDDKHVSLLGLISFCLSNLIDPEPLIGLLRGYGMEVS